MAPPDPKLELVLIFQSDDPIAFELAKAVLEEAGVEYLALEDPPARMGFTPFLNTMRRILIPAYRKDEAVALIEQAQGEMGGEED